MRKALIILLIFFAQGANSQNFQRINNLQISNPQLGDYWTGSSFIDIDDDGDLDLFLSDRVPGQNLRQNKLYRNNNGNFLRLSNSDLANDFGHWFGASWGDYNNDGLIDVIVSGYPSKLYTNLGNGQFNRVGNGQVASCSFSGISAAWADLNNDGFLDLLMVRPNWLGGPPCSGTPGGPHLMINSGPPGFTFNRIIDPILNANGSDTYLHPYFVDFDDDNDLDLFIGMGSGMSKPDLAFRNLFTENGVLQFEKINDQIMGTDSVEGNQWAFIDIDNDLDLDAYITNWANVIGGQNQARSNNLYRNVNGTFIKDSIDIISNLPSLSTSSLWGDFDNDADLDCIIPADYNYPMHYLQNDGAGNFIEISGNGINTIDLHQSGGTIGDYDNDGDLDIYVPGPGDSTALLRNDLNNQNHWLKIKLRGSNSNGSGIGAKIFVKTTSNGYVIRQRRDFTSSDVFFGQNANFIHFGLSQSDIIDSLIIQWPSGIIDQFDSLPSDQVYEVLEGTGILSSFTSKHIANSIVVYPNPFDDDIIVLIPENQKVMKFELINIEGGIESSVTPEYMLNNNFKINTKLLKSGVYFIKIELNDGSLITKKLMK